MMFVLFLFTLLHIANPGLPPATLTKAVNRVGLVEELKGRVMAIDVAGYLEEVRKVFASGVAQEHAYRPALEKLFKSITPDVTAINEPKGIKVGRPDFVFLRSVGKGADITIGHCEAKDVGLGINPKGMSDFNKAQHERYVKALPNLVYTNGLDWRFYKKGELVREISIADFVMGIQPKPDQFTVLAHQLEDFCAERLQTITSAEKLAEMMAGKAVLIKDILFNSLKDDKDLRTDLTGQYESFKEMLIHDLSAEDFADLYAETIAYGMFGARLHDKTLDSFSRAEALDLMPKSNPFLRNLFTYVAGPQLDERIRRTIDELAEIFQATDLQKLFEDFGKFTQRNDPFIHFYETFLAEYNPAKRKARGVWYTPEPVVNFIVRAVDDVLKTEFGLPMGLADTSKVTVDWDTGQTDKKGKANHHQEGGSPRADSRSGSGHRHLPCRSDQADCTKGEGRGRGAVVQLRRKGTDPPPAWLRVAHGFLRHVPHEAGHDADGDGLQAHIRHTAAPQCLPHQLAGRRRARQPDPAFCPMALQ
jgi:hypothetical protein